MCISFAIPVGGKYCMERLKQTETGTAGKPERALAISNINDALRNTKTNDAAGIHVQKLAGNSEMTIFAAELHAGKSVKPHYHEHGMEIYYIVHGIGQMRIGEIDQNLIHWLDERHIRTGDCCAVPEGTVHQLISTGRDPLRALFCCPSNHLDSDRFFIDTGE